jgi:hypothetical protein
MAVKIYSDRRYVAPGAVHHCILAPFWGSMEDLPEPVSCGRYDGLLKSGTQYLQLTESPEDADLVVIPVTWNHYQRRHREDLGIAFARDMEPYNKQLVVFADCDRYEPLPFPQAVEFRTSLYRSAKKPREFATPAWVGDLVQRFCGGVLPLREKRDIPVVGFCGVPAPDVRVRALEALHRSPRVKTNFILRPSFFGAAMHWGHVNQVITSHWHGDDVLRVRHEFVQNMIDSDYVVCARGGGNFSHRFYETLMFGRIPIFIDTDCVLPFHDAIDWKRYGIWIEESQLDLLPARVAEFHERISPGEFIELQRACRQLWEERLCVEGFFRHLAEHFAIPSS